MKLSSLLFLFAITIKPLIALAMQEQSSGKLSNLKITSSAAQILTKNTKKFTFPSEVSTETITPFFQKIKSTFTAFQSKQLSKQQLSWKEKTLFSANISAILEAHKKYKKLSDYLADTQTIQLHDSYLSACRTFNSFSIAAGAISLIGCGIAMHNNSRTFVDMAKIGIFAFMASCILHSYTSKQANTISTQKAAAIKNQEILKPLCDIASKDELKKTIQTSRAQEDFIAFSQQIALPSKSKKINYNLPKKNIKIEEGESEKEKLEAMMIHAAYTPSSKDLLYTPRLITRNIMHSIRGQCATHFLLIPSSCTAISSDTHYATHTNTQTLYTQINQKTGKINEPACVIKFIKIILHHLNLQYQLWPHTHLKPIALPYYQKILLASIGYIIHVSTKETLSSDEKNNIIKEINTTLPNFINKKVFIDTINPPQKSQHGSPKTINELLACLAIDTDESIKEQLKQYLRNTTNSANLELIVNEVGFIISKKNKTISSKNSSSKIYTKLKARLKETSDQDGALNGSYHRTQMNSLIQGAIKDINERSVDNLTNGKSVEYTVKY